MNWLTLNYAKKQKERYLTNPSICSQQASWGKDEHFLANAFLPSCPLLLPCSPMPSVIGLNPDRSLSFIKSGRKQDILQQNNPCPNSSKTHMVLSHLNVAHSVLIYVVTDPSTPANSRDVAFFSIQSLYKWEYNILIFSLPTAKATEV